VRATLGLVAVLALAAACGANPARTTTTIAPTIGTTGAPTTTIETTATATATGAYGGLTIALMADPSHGPASTPVMFTLKATESQAPGALRYQIAYGDGATDANAAPMYCTAGPGRAASQAWSLAHRYSAPGTYTVTATVGVNCSPDRATATLTVSP
jgi:PKD repeat protein